MGARCKTCGFPVEDHPVNQGADSPYCQHFPWQYLSLQKQLDQMGLHIQAMKIKVSDAPVAPATQPTGHRPWMSYYLACPYTDKSKARSWARTEIASQVAARLMTKDSVVFSPITHGHHIADHLPPDLLHDHDFWMHQCLPFVTWAEAFAVLPLTGWRESRGVQKELALARSLNKPVLVLQLPGYPMCELFTPEQAQEAFGPSTFLEII